MKTKFDKSKLPRRVTGNSSDRDRVPNVRLLSRIIMYLKEEKSHSNITDLKESIQSSGKIQPAVKWLVNNKILLVEKIGSSSTKMYSINKKWMDL